MAKKKQKVQHYDAGGSVDSLQKRVATSFYPDATDYGTAIENARRPTNGVFEGQYDNSAEVQKRARDFGINKNYGLPGQPGSAIQAQPATVQESPVPSPPPGAQTPPQVPPPEQKPVVQAIAPSSRGSVISGEALNSARDRDFQNLNNNYAIATDQGRGAAFARGTVPQWGANEMALINAHIRSSKDEAPHAIYGGGQTPSGPAFSSVDQLARLQAIDPERYGSPEGQGGANNRSSYEQQVRTLGSRPEVNVGEDRYATLNSLAAAHSWDNQMRRLQDMQEHREGNQTQMGIARLNNRGALDVAQLHGRNALDVEGMRAGNALDVENLRGEHGYRAAALGHDPELVAAQAEHYRSQADHQRLVDQDQVEANHLSAVAQAEKDPAKRSALERESEKLRQRTTQNQATIHAAAAQARAAAELQMSGMKDGGQVQGYAEGGAVGRPSPVPEYGAAPQVNPLMAQYGQYLHAASQAGVAPIPFPHYINLVSSAQKQLQATPPPNFAAGGEIPGYAYGGFLDFMGEMGNQVTQLPGRIRESLTPNVSGAINSRMRNMENEMDNYYHGAPQPAPAPQAPPPPPAWAPTPEQLAQNAKTTTPYTASGPVPGFAQGGGIPVAGKQLDGPGTGTSDSIPALIDGHKPAALSRGEFVIPAHVVRAKGTEFFDKLIASYAPGGEQANG